MTRQARARAITAAFVVACLGPAMWLGWLAWSDELGANPIEEVTHVTGEWTLRMLLATLCVTPLRSSFGLAWLAPQRRTLGLFTFFYATLHFLTYAVFDSGLELQYVKEDILERPYITVGFTGLLLLLPLALTSTRGAIRRLGRRWVRLHRLVYLAAICGVVHFYWLVKADVREPLVYAGIVGALLAWRVAKSRWFLSLRQRSATNPSA